MAEDMTKTGASEKTLIRDISFCGVPENGSQCSMVDVKDGKIVRIRPMHYDWKYKRRGAEAVEDGGPGQDLRAEHEDASSRRYSHRLQEARVLAGPDPLSDDAGGLRSQRRAQIRRTAA